MTAWHRYINSFMRDGLCWDVAVVSMVQQQILLARQGGILARMTKPEIQALLGRDRDSLLTQGLTLGGLECLVIRDNLYTGARQYTMDLRTKLHRDNYSCAITVVLVNPVCLIFIGEKGIHGGTLSMKALRAAQYMKANKHH